MIKFEEHEGKLFRMLEEPVPLTDDAELPVLVRLIQDDTMLGKANKRRCHPDTLAQKIICSSSNLTDDGLFMDGDYTYRYEIIGYPVADGSAEWALHQMMQGKMVCHETSPWDWYRMYNDHVIQNRTVGYMDRVSAWLESTVQSGWQIYEEPEPQYKVGDWVEWCGDQYMVESAPPQSGGRYDIRSPYYELGCSVYPENITRKLSPSEVIVRIGCLSGTVRCCENEFICPESTPDNPCHFVLQDQITGFWSIIYFKMLDAPTRELVESLLKAQEEESND